MQNNSNSNNRVSNRDLTGLGLDVENYILLFLWAVWWGGLTFYATVVVPIGTEVLGSVAQGFITRRVTQWHNAVSGLLLIALFFTACRRRSRGLWMACVAMSVVTLALVLGHARLTGMMDFENQSVASGFYRNHAIYLWITAIEWIIGMLLPICFLHRASSNCTLNLDLPVEPRS